MIFITTIQGLLLAANDASSSFTATEFDLPESPVVLLCAVSGLILLITFVIRVYIRDTADLSRAWTVWLITLRMGAIGIVVFILFNLRERTQHQSFRPSRVAIVVDTSLSMGFPHETEKENGPESGQSRSEAVRKLLDDSDLLATLRKTHDVSVYTFDSALEGPHAVLPSGRHERSAPHEDVRVGSVAAASVPNGNPSDWSRSLEPSGLETRLGESLQDLIRKIAGRTLSGIVVISDGGSNAGIDPQAAHDLARLSKVRLFGVGVGGTEQPVNLMISGIQAPTDVQLGDEYDLIAWVQGQGLSGRSIDVELLMRSEGAEQPPTLVESKTVELLEDGIPVEIRFSRTPSVAGSVEYFLRAKPSFRVPELSDDDNERRRIVRIIERRFRILMIAGGPLRDFRFVRNMLYRHSGMDVDVWLQTVELRRASLVSQEGGRLLTEFPDNAAELAEYDVIIGFDPDWRMLTDDQRSILQNWVSEHSGGVILVAGDVHTPELASAADQMDDVQELYPVYLNPMIIDIQLEQRGSQAWPLDFTRDGLDAGFLLLSDTPAATTDLWDQFDGVFRCYPTGGARAGSTVFAHFSDPRMQTEHGQPILLASQFYGSGRTMFIGSPEMWRLRSVSDEYYDRFWTKAIREVGQGRLKRGSSRGMLLQERSEYALGQTIRIRAQLYDPQLKPYDADAFPFDVFDPSGRPVVPSPRMLKDGNRPGQYVGSFRAGQRGTWLVTVPIPESRDQLKGRIDVVVPNLESQNPQQNSKLLTELARDTGGSYIPVAQATEKLPGLLPDRSEQLMIDERLRTLWDRQWLLFLLVGLLSVEWLTRKLLKLA